jgi:hypothetical protein
VLTEPPRNTRLLTPGAIFRDGDGLLCMKVRRLKRGQNPFVTLHPAAESFLSAWGAWLTKTQPDIRNLMNLADNDADATLEETLFPLGTTDQTILNRALNRASAFLELKHFTPHGFGRAFYVKVRRSMGKDDAEIAGELGQNSNGELIRSVYGDPYDLRGGALFDWLPEHQAPAWNLLDSDVPVANPARTELSSVPRRRENQFLIPPKE